MLLKVAISQEYMVELFHGDFQDYLGNGLSDTEKSIFLALCKPVNQILLWINMAQNRNSYKNV
jgi:hypothetical protein